MAFIAESVALESFIVYSKRLKPLESWFDAFSSREPAATSLENALKSRFRATQQTLFVFCSKPASQVARPWRWHGSDRRKRRRSRCDTIGLAHALSRLAQNTAFAGGFFQGIQSFSCGSAQSARAPDCCKIAGAIGPAPRTLENSDTAFCYDCVAFAQSEISSQGNQSHMRSAGCFAGTGLVAFAGIAQSNRQVGVALASANRNGLKYIRFAAGKLVKPCRCPRAEAGTNSFMRLDVTGPRQVADGKMKPVAKAHANRACASGVAVL